MKPTRTLLVVDLQVNGQTASMLMSRIATGMDSMQIGDIVQLEQDDSIPVKCISRFWEFSGVGYTLELALSDARFDGPQVRDLFAKSMETRGWIRGYPTDEQWATHESM